jgi:hypothetical protein
MVFFWNLKKLEQSEKSPDEKSPKLVTLVTLYVCTMSTDYILKSFDVRVCVSGWPDWVKFRLLGGCLLRAPFWKLQKWRKFWKYLLFPRCKLHKYYFSQKRAWATFWAILSWTHLVTLDYVTSKNKFLEWKKFLLSFQKRLRLPFPRGICKL